MPRTIPPSVSFSTYLRGYQTSVGKSLVVDAKGNIVVAGYGFSYQTLYYDPVLTTFAAGNADNGLQELVLTVTGPNNAKQTLQFLKVQP